jgi:putative polymerase
VSATRPDNRLFGFISFHRLSSTFLEPVSLGNYCIVVVAFVCARFTRLRWPMRWFLLGGAVLAIIGSDGRLAAVTSSAIIVVSMFAARLPRHSWAMYLPAVAMVAFLLVELAAVQSGSDDFIGRIAHTMELLKRFSLAEYVGLSTDRTLLAEAVDSGFAYLILTQSLVGLAAIWLVVAFAARNATPEQVRFAHATCIYLSFSMMVSFAFLTVKTAALLWFIYGALCTAQPFESFNRTERPVSPGARFRIAA